MMAGGPLVGGWWYAEDSLDEHQEHTITTQTNTSNYLQVRFVHVEYEVDNGAFTYK